MSAKKKIKVIMADPTFLVTLGTWERLALTHDVSISLLVPKGPFKGPQTSVPIKLFEEISDMHGYLRGLEDDLVGADLAFSFQTVQLATFQAVRSGVKNGFPVVVLSDDHSIFAFQSYPNLRAIQTDVHEHASHFLCLSDYTKDVLSAEGVPSERISPFSLELFPEDSFRQQKLREKFRGYIGLRPDENLITWTETHASHQELEAVLIAFQQLKRMNPVTAQATKIMFCIPQTVAEPFKYMAHDMGLSKQTLFMHQDISTFREDLMCATDAILMPWLKGYQGFPSPLFEAVQCGARAIVTEGSFNHKLVGEAAIGFKSENSLGLTMSFMTLAAARKAGVKVEHPVKPLDPKFLEFIESMTSQSVNKEESINGLFERLDRAMEQHQLQDAKIIVEDLILRVSPQQHSLMALIKVRKGQLSLQERNWEDAMNLFSEALSFQPRQVEALLGLGQISFHTQSYEESQRFYRRVLSIDPASHHAFLGLGLMNQKIQNIDEAMFWLKKALDNAKSHPLALTSIIQIALDSADAYEAVKLLEELRDNGIETTNLKMALGQCYIRTGDVEAGNALIHQAMSQGVPSIAS